MDIKAFPALIVGVVVALVLAGAVLPVFAETTSATDTFKNEGVFYYGEFTPTDTYVLSFDKTNTDAPITVNGVDVPTFPAVGKAYSIVSTDNFVARYGVDNNGPFLQCIGVTSSNSVFADGGVTATISISDGALSVVYVKSDETTVTKTVSFNDMYAIVPNESDAIMKGANSDVYIKGDSELYATGITSVSQWYNVFHFDGTYTDGITITSPNLEGATYDNITWNITPISGYNDLYRLTSIEFDITYNGAVTHATYSYFGVPSEVTAEKTVHPDGALSVMLNVLPLLAIAGLVTGAVVWFINRKG